MNWLAHIFLSDNHIEYQHGNLLADLLKGRAWEGASDQFNAGLSMHRFIDRFTDQHPRYKESKSKLGESGLLRGVVIDVTYDHLLVRNWQKYSAMSFRDFIDAFHRRSEMRLDVYPDHVNAFLARLIATGHLLDYGSIDGIEKALCRIDARLSVRASKRDSAVRYLPIIRTRVEAIEEDFLCFMPELISPFKSISRVSLDDPWLR